MTATTYRLNHTALLLLVLSVGLALRLYAAIMGQGYHHTAMGDEVSAYQYMLAFLAGEPQALYLAQPVFAGTQIPGPLWTLFGITLYTLGGESIANATILMALFNTIAIFIVYRLGICFLDRNYALFVAALYAISPWPIYYAAGMWNPIPLPVFGGFLILALWKSYTIEQSRIIFFVPLLCAILFQLHTIVIFYIPAILLLIVLARKRINSRWFIIGIIAGSLLYLPYLIGEMSSDWSNTKNLFSVETKKSLGFIKALTSPPTLTSSLPGKLADKTAELKEFGDIFFLRYQIMIALLVPSILISLAIYFGFIRKYIHVVIRAIRRKEDWLDNKTLFIGTVVFVPTLLFMLTGHNYASRYALITLPLLFIVVGLFVQNLTRYRKAIKNFFIFTFVLNIYISLGFYSFQGETIMQGQIFKPSLRKMSAISQIINSEKSEHSHIEISLSPPIESLPSVDLGKFKALINFINLEQKYIYDTTSDDTTKTRFYISTLAEPVNPQRSIIYTDGSIFIEKEKPLH